MWSYASGFKNIQVVKVFFWPESNLKAVKASLFEQGFFWVHKVSQKPQVYNSKKVQRQFFIIVSPDKKCIVESTNLTKCHFFLHEIIVVRTRLLATNVSIELTMTIWHASSTNVLLKSSKLFSAFVNICQTLAIHLERVFMSVTTRIILFNYNTGFPFVPFLSKKD